ncbi:MAG: hypothetical protein ACM3ZA_01360 [Bacillota bacterium]
MKTLKNIAAGILVSAMVLGTAAIALADDTPAPMVDEPRAASPQTPDQADREGRRQAADAFRTALQAERDQLLSQRSVLEQLRAEIKVKVEEIKPLVAEARQNKDRQALLRIQGERAQVRAHLQVVREKTEANKALWAELKDAVQNRDALRATTLARQIIANRQVKIEALRKVSAILDNLIEDLQGSQPTVVPSISNS